MISPRRLISPWRDVGSSRGGVSPRRGVGKQNDVMSDEQTELTIDRLIKRLGLIIRLGLTPRLGPTPRFGTFTGEVDGVINFLEDPFYK
jgi:hypothetical protein